MNSSSPVCAKSTKGTYRIIYSSHDEELQVVTIIHMKQRLPRSRLR